MKTQKLYTFATMTLTLAFLSCGEQTKKAEAKKDTMEMEAKAETPMEPEYNTDAPESILAAVEYAQGGWGDLWSKKDVEYTYDYRLPDGKADVSVERYIFSDEASLGRYTQHDINVYADRKGRSSTIL